MDNGRYYLNGVAGDDGCSGAGWNGKLLQRPADMQATIRPPPGQRPQTGPAPVPQQQQQASGVFGAVANVFKVAFAKD